MAEDIEPVVGNWYRRLDKGQPFEVVSVDEEAGLVEVQHFDGDLEEFSLDDWYDMEVEIIEDPENWTGPYDDEDEDFSADDEGMTEDEWDEELDETPSDEFGNRRTTENEDEPAGDEEDWR